MTIKQFSAMMAAYVLTILAIGGLFALGAFLGGCASPKPQTIEKIVYINKPCERAADFAPPTWQPVRWIALDINGSASACTTDINALLGNLSRIDAKY